METKLEGWFLSRKDYTALSKFLLKRVESKTIINKPTINDLSSRIEKLLSDKSFPNLFYVESLWICSQARKYIEEDKILRIVLIFLEELEKKIEQFNLVSTEDLSASDKDQILNSFRIENNSIVSIIVDFLKKHIPNAKPCVKHCLTKKEVLNIKEYISKAAVSDDGNEDLEKLLDGKQLKTISKFNKYALFSKYEQDIYKLWEISESEDDYYEIAFACIKYIHMKNDVIEDSYGLLGLVDDLYAIDYAMSIINKKNDIQTLVNIHDSQFPSFRLPEIVSKQGIISTLNLEHIIKASYTKKDDQEIKRLMIVPDVGPLSILSILGHSICNRLIAKKEIQDVTKFQSGDKLLLGKYQSSLYQKNVVVEFDQQCREYPNLYFVYDNKGFRQTVQERHIRNAFKANQDIKLSSGKTISKFKNQNNPIIEGWSKIYFQKNISKIDSNGPVYFFTTKYIAKKYLKEKIYGNTLESMLGVRTFDEKYNFTDTFSNKQLFPEPQLYLISSNEVGIELLNQRIEALDVRKPSLIIIDNEKFYKDPIFMEELDKIDVDKLIFIEVYKDSAIKDLIERNYDCVTTKPRKDSFSHTENFLPINSPTAMYLERSSVFEISYIVNKKEVLSKFIANINEIKNELKNDDLYLFYKLINLKDSVRSQIIERNGENLKKFKENINNVINELSYLEEFNHKYLNLLNFLKNNSSELEKINKENELLNFIEKNKSRDNLILVAGSKINEVKNFIEKNNNQNFKDIKVVNPKELEDINSSTIENVLIPSFISKNIMQKLRNYKYGKNHIHFGIQEEKDIHDKNLKKERKIFEINFQNSSEFIHFKNQKPEKDNVLDTSAADLFKNIFNDFNLTNFQKTDSLESIKAKMLGFEGGKVLLVPENGKEYLIVSNNVHLETVSMLKEDDEILINSLFSGEELIKNMLSNDKIEHDKYLKFNEIAKSWKTVLKNYQTEKDLSIKDIQDQLSGFGITRDISTIRNWLNSPYTLAPQKRQETISKIFKLAGINDDSSIKECLSSIKIIRKLENNARNQLVELLNKEDLSRQDISLNFNDLNIEFNKKTIHAITDMYVPSKFLYKIQNIETLIENINNG